MRHSFILLTSVLFSTAAVASTDPVALPVSAAAVAAPSVPTVAALPAVPAGPMMLILPANTDVIVTPDALLTSKKMKSGNKFNLSTAADVVQDGYVVIPRGTVGEGTVTYQKKAGSFGKSGKMEVQFNSLTFNGQRVGLTGRHRQEGKGNGGAAVGAVVAFGLVGGVLVKGHAAEIANGQQLHARTAEALNYTVPAGTVPMSAAAVPTTVTAPK
jgi:hypothetical protein